MMFIDGGAWQRAQRIAELEGDDGEVALSRRPALAAVPQAAPEAATEAAVAEAAPAPAAPLIETLPPAAFGPPPPTQWRGEPPEPHALHELAAAEVRPPAPPPPSAAAAPAAAVLAAPALERPVEAAWLQTREAALQGVRADYEGARTQALATPGSGPGWVATVPATDESGRVIGGATLVFVSDPAAPPEVAGWDEGGPVYRPSGQWFEFNDEAFAAHYRAQGGAALQNLARSYDTDAATLLAQHPEVWGIATTDHAINAGPPPVGRAMGDAGQLGMLDLYMADRQVAALVDAFGGDASPATSGIAREQVRIYGQERYEQLTRLGNAMQSVRDQYSTAMAEAQRNGGPGWVERPRTLTVSDEGGAVHTQPLYITDESGQPLRDVSGQPQVATERVFDPDGFTAWYTAQAGLANKAFADFYGQSHTRYATDESGRTQAASIAFDNPSWSVYGVGGPMAHKDLVSLDPNHAPRLNDDSQVGFDLDAGWATHSSNIHQDRDWLDTVLPLVVVGVVSYFSAGTLGPAAAGAMGLTTTAATGAVTLTAAGMVVSAAVAGAATSLASGMVSGNLSLKDVLKGALSGALTAGLLGDAAGLNSQFGAAGAVAVRTTVQGGISALLGGSFKDGAIAGFASGLAQLTASSMQDNITQQLQAGTMTPEAAESALRFSRVLGSAIRIAANPGDPGSAFANEFLQGVLASVAPPPPLTAPAGDAPATAPAGPDQSDAETARLGRPPAEAADDPVLQVDANTRIDTRVPVPTAEDDAAFQQWLAALDPELAQAGDAGTQYAANEQADPAAPKTTTDAGPGGPADGAGQAVRQTAVAGVFTRENLIALPTLQIQGAGDRGLATAMTVLQGERDAATGEWSIRASEAEIDGHLLTVAAARGEPIEKIRAAFDRYITLAAEREAASRRDGYVPRPYVEGANGETRAPLLSMGTVEGRPNNAPHMGSIEQLRCGRLVGDALGVDPVFGALLSPTGGIAGAGNKEVGGFAYAAGGGKDIVVTHGIAHDAGGFLLNYYGVGPGYHYVPDGGVQILDRANPLAGQVDGLRFFFNLKHYGTPDAPPPGTTAP